MSLPVCTYNSGGFRHKSFPSVAEFGHRAAKNGLLLSYNVGFFLNMPIGNKSSQLALLTDFQVAYKVMKA